VLRGVKEGRDEADEEEEPEPEAFASAPAGGAVADGADGVADAPDEELMTRVCSASGVRVPLDRLLAAYRSASLGATQRRRTRLSMSGDCGGGAKAEIRMDPIRSRSC